MNQIEIQGEQAKEFIGKYKGWMASVLIICLWVIFVFYV